MSDNAKDNFSIIRIMLICLSMVYAGIIIAISFVCYKIFTQKIKIRIIYAFYISLIILVLSRALTFFIIGINPGSVEEKNQFSDFIIYLMTNAPDLINSCVYILLVWVFFNIFIYSHVSLSFDINTTGDSYKFIGKNINIGLWIVIAFYCVVFVVLGEENDDDLN